MGIGSGAGAAISEARREKARRKGKCYEVCAEYDYGHGWYKTRECWEECATEL